MIKFILGILIIVLYSAVIFLIGFSVGNTKASDKNINEKLTATERLLKAQGDKPEEIKATLDYLRAEKLDKAGGVKREILSIWLPSILVIANIILTILFKNIK